VEPVERLLEVMDQLWELLASPLIMEDQLMDLAVLNLYHPFSFKRYTESQKLTASSLRINGGNEFVPDPLPFEQLKNMKPEDVFFLTISMLLWCGI